MKTWIRIGAAIVLGWIACSAMAAVVSSGEDGFVVREEVVFSGTPAVAWQRLIRPQDWWNKDHTYSKDSRNLSLSLQPGGCWCEQLADGGFVRHMEVVLAKPGSVLRLLGGLGPLQAIGASGALTFTLKAISPDATQVTAHYAVVGYSKDGFAQLAQAVDEVLGEQMKRFAGAL